MRILINLTATALLLTACGGSDHTAAKPTPATTPAAATYDGSTLAACRAADKVVNGNLKDASEQAHAARASAELSDVPALRAVAAKNTDDTNPDRARDDARALAAAYTISTWCLQHHVKQ